MATVTVVDDEPVFLDVMVRAAKTWEYECQAAHSAEQALDLLERNPTPVVVTDLRMPGRGGVWLVQEIQRRWPEAAIIVITAHEDSEAVAQCLDAGAHHFFLKPVNLDEFHHTLEAALRTQKRHAEHRRSHKKLELLVRHKTRKVRRTYLAAINSLVRTLEARDAYTCGHSRRVSKLAARLSGELGLDGSLRKKLSLAAKLHDIGKVGLPETILNKPEPLTPEECATVRDHPVIGERILSPVIRSRQVLAAIRGHHERYDGKGYPDGLRGDNIPLLARIITVVDSFDALTSDRAYRKARPVLEALEVLRHGSGTQFDPLLAAAFVKMIHQDLEKSYYTLADL